MTTEFDRRWNQKFEQLCAFKRKNGHCNIPHPSQTKASNHSKSLGHWVASQKIRRHAGNLPQDRIDRLEMIGFVWGSSKNESWDHMFGQLCEFKKKYGHCLVPASNVKGKENDDEFRSLGLWVQTQRQQKKGTRKSRIPHDRIDRLDEIGFVWEPRDATWNESFEQLKKFREENGHCNVPKVTKKLHSWVDKQRDCYRKGKMRSDRKAKLDSIDFMGSGTKSHQLPTKQARGKVETAADYLRFDRLVEFNKIHGHWRVPPSYEKDTSLAKWIESQRTRRTTMKPERVKRLNSIGFPWTTIDGDSTSNNVSETNTFQERNETKVNNDESSFGTATDDTEDESSVSFCDFNTANEGSESDSCFNSSESDSCFNISSKGMSVDSRSTSDKKLCAIKPAEYPVGTKVRTVRAKNGIDHLAPCFIMFLFLTLRLFIALSVVC